MVRILPLIVAAMLAAMLFSAGESQAAVLPQIAGQAKQTASATVKESSEIFVRTRVSVGFGGFHGRGVGFGFGGFHGRGVGFGFGVPRFRFGGVRVFGGPGFGYGPGFSGGYVGGSGFGGGFGGGYAGGGYGAQIAVFDQFGNFLGYR